MSSVGSFFSYVNDARSHELEVIIGLQTQVSPTADVSKILRSAIQLQVYYSSFQKNTSAWPKLTDVEKHDLRHYHYLLTPWSRVLLEKVTGSAASQEIPRIFGTRRFITAFTSARHLSLSWASSTQSTSWISILILSSHLRLHLASGLFPPGSPTTHWIQLSSPPHVLHARPIKFFSILSPEQYWVSSTDH